MRVFIGLLISAVAISTALGQGYQYKPDHQGYRPHGYGYKKCPDLDDPANGSVDVKGRKPGDKAVYDCNPGYELSGVKVRVCGKNGEWSDEPPTCPPVDCGPPPAPNPNSIVEVDSTTFRSIANYTCNVGYLLDTSNGGCPYIYCQANGQWSGIAPLCIRIDCKWLPTPAYGVVDFVPDTSLGSVARFRCIRGFELVGSPYRICQTNGIWSMTQPICERVYCPKLDDPKNGRVKTTGQYVDDYAFYSCDYGFQLSGNKHRSCQQDGTWSGTEPKCVAVKKHPYGYPSSHGYDHDKKYDHGYN